MKPKTRSLPALAFSSILAFALCAGWVPAQTALDLDLQPAFDFGDDPAADPFFAPATLGLTNGMATTHQGDLSGFRLALLARRSSIRSSPMGAGRPLRPHWIRGRKP